MKNFKKINYAEALRYYILQARISSACYLLKLSLYFNNAFFAAWLLRFGIIRKFDRGNRWNIIAFSKPIFNEEIKEIFSEDPEYTVYSLHTMLLKSIARHFIDPSVNHHNYKDYANMHSEKIDAYYDFMCKTFQILKKIMNLHCVVSFNFGGEFESSLGYACKQHNILFICLYKEGLMSKGLADHCRLNFSENRCPFSGHFIITTSECSRNNLISFKSFPAANIYSLGSVRFDKFHAARQESHLSKKYIYDIALFYFNDYVQTPELMKSTKKPVWHNLKMKTLSIILNYAKNYPNKKIIIKYKNRDEKEIRATLKNIPSNIILNQDLSSSMIIFSSKILCGFNSSTIYEALAMGRLCIVPCFAEASNSINCNFLLPYATPDIYMAKTPDQLEDVFLRSDKIYANSFIKNLSQDSFDLLENLFGNADGNSIPRVKKFFNNKLQKFHN